MKYNKEPVDSLTNIMASKIPKTSEVQTQHLTNKHAVFLCWVPCEFCKIIIFLPFVTKLSLYLWFLRLTRRFTQKMILLVTVEFTYNKNPLYALMGKYIYPGSRLLETYYDTQVNIYFCNKNATKQNG